MAKLLHGSFDYSGIPCQPTYAVGNFKPAEYCQQRSFDYSRNPCQPIQPIWAVGSSNPVQHDLGKHLEDI